MGVLGGVFVLKSGLRILIRAPQVPFLVPPKAPKMGHFGCFWLFWGYLEARDLKLIKAFNRENGQGFNCGMLKVLQREC